MINLCFINGSPKANNKSNSDFFIKELSSYFNDNVKISEYYASKVVKDPSLLRKIVPNDKIIMVSPLYADTFPSGMLEFLSLLEAYVKTNNSNNIEIYGMINCGFFEGLQCRHALDMLKYFSRKANLKWRFGICIGGGEYLNTVPNGIKNSIHAESLCKALNILGQDINISDHNKQDNIFINPDKMTASIYRLAANFGWCFSAYRDNKISIPHLFKKIY